MRLLTKKKEKETKPLFKAQPKFYDSKPEGIDFASPSIVKENIPKEISSDGIKFNDYNVEVGGTSIIARYFRSFFAEIVSGNSWAGMLDNLKTQRYGKGDVDLAIHIRPVSNKSELDDIERRIAGLKSEIPLETSEAKKSSMWDEIRDLEKKQARIRREIEKSFRASIQVITSATDYKEMQKIARSVVHGYAGKSIYLRAADGFQLDALKTTIPTAPPVDVMKEHFLSMETSNLADLFPFNNGSLSHKTGIIIGVDMLDRPVWLDGWHPNLTNQNMLIVGRSGAGKTQTIMLITHRSAHIGIRSAIIDWKGEYRDFVIAMNCPYIELGEDSIHRINPYDVDVTEELDGRKYVDLETSANFVQALVYKMIRTFDAKVLNGEIKVFILDAIREQYKEKGITREIESLYEKQSSGRFNIKGQMKRMPELSGLYEKMANADSENVRKVAELLKPFTRHGNSPSFAIFDGQTNVELKNAPIIGFDIHKLEKEIMRPIGLAAVAKWLDEKFTKRDLSQKKRLIIEEAQNIFDDEDVGGVWAESQYREARFTNTSVTGVTQGLEVFTRSKAGIAALKNSPIKIIGIQEQVDIDRVQGILALTDGETDFLLTQARKGNMLVKIDNEKQYVYVDGTRFERMLFTTNPNDPLYHERKEYMKELFKKKEMMKSEKIG